MRRALLLCVLLPLLAACGATPIVAPTVVVTARPAVATATVPAKATNAPLSSASTSVPPTPAKVSTIAPTAAPAPPTAVPPTKVPTVASTPTVAPARVKVLQVVSFKDSLGDLTVIGLVQNTGGGMATSIKVSAEAVDAAGATVGTGDDNLLALVGLAAGQKAPFEISMGSLTGTMAKVNVTAQAEPYDPNGFNIFPPATGLSIEGSKFAPETAGSLPKVTGRVKNGANTTTENVEVLVAGYDAKGNLVDVAKGGPTQDTIAPGQAAPFTVTFYRTGSNVAKVELLPVGTVKAGQ